MRTITHPVCASPRCAPLLLAGADTLDCERRAPRLPVWLRPADGRVVLCKVVCVGERGIDKQRARGEGMGGMAVHVLRKVVCVGDRRWASCSRRGICVWRRRAVTRGYGQRSVGSVARASAVWPCTCCARSYASASDSERRRVRGRARARQSLAIFRQRLGLSSWTG